MPTICWENKNNPGIQDKNIMEFQTVRLKASRLPFTTLELQNLDYETFHTELKALTSQMPGFFGGAPVVINLNKLESLDGFDAQCLFDCCQQLNLQPIAFLGLDEQKTLVEAQGYIFLPQKQDRKEFEVDTIGSTETAEPEKNAANPSTNPATEAEIITSRPSKLITQPVRSGQQIYAPGSDLIIMNNVSEAAEVLADGHIHIYGTLRGRALAGVNGDQSARIFCHKLEAQLLSVGGYFKLSEDFQDSVWGKRVQAYLNDQTLAIEPLTI
jgi:septum site-determining protein MinC